MTKKYWKKALTKIMFPLPKPKTLYTICKYCNSDIPEV